MTKQRDEERALHDYLDGRLSEEGRKRFEARMEREPELARRVAACRGLGRSLREGDEELSPAFYTRARAAFEEASGGRAARSWFRPLSWETAGLAAVVLVAAALYVPGLVRAPSGRDAFTEQRPPVAEKALIEKPEGLAAGQIVDDEVTLRQATPDPETAPASSDLAERRGAVGKDDLSGLSDVGYAQAPPVEREESGHGGLEKKETPPTGELGDKGADAEAERLWAPSPAPETQAVEAVPAPPPAQRAKRLPERPAEEQSRKADAMRYSLGVEEPVDGDGPGRPAATPLPSGLVEPGAIRVIEEPEDWSTLLVGSAEQVLAELGGYAPNSRLVLIGSRPEPFDCARVSIVASETEYWILLSPPLEGGRAAEHGCAVLLPRDGRTIEIAPGGSD